MDLGMTSQLEIWDLWDWQWDLSTVVVHQQFLSQCIFWNKMVHVHKYIFFHRALSDIKLGLKYKYLDNISLETQTNWKWIIFYAHRSTEYFSRVLKFTRCFFTANMSWAFVFFWISRCFCFGLSHSSHFLPSIYFYCWIMNSELKIRPAVSLDVMCSFVTSLMSLWTLGFGVERFKVDF